MVAYDIKQLPSSLFPLAPVTIITGHYGTGKTNLTLNLALDATSMGQKVTVIDLDIVNPYFRSSDYEALLALRDVPIIAPTLSGTTLDTPSLSGKIYAAIEAATKGAPVIIDAGGDEEGAKALGRFASTIKGAVEPYEMFYIINGKRSVISGAREAILLLGDIERRSRLKATGIVNNTHLLQETTLEMVKESRNYANENAELLGLPLVCTTVPVNLVKDELASDLYPVARYVLAPWE